MISQNLPSRLGSSNKCKCIMLFLAVQYHYLILFFPFFFI